MIGTSYCDIEFVLCFLFLRKIKLPGLPKNGYPLCDPGLLTSLYLFFSTLLFFSFFFFFSIPPSPPPSLSFSFFLFLCDLELLLVDFLIK